MKFFGNLAIMDSPQQICERYPIFVEKVFEMTESQDPTMIGVAVDTIGLLGSNVEGKQVLQKTGWYDLFWFSLRCSFLKNKNSFAAMLNFIVEAAFIGQSSYHDLQLTPKKSHNYYWIFF